MLRKKSKDSIAFLLLPAAVSTTTVERIGNASFNTAACSCFWYVIGERDEEKITSPQSEHDRYVPSTLLPSSLVSASIWRATAC